MKRLFLYNTNRTSPQGFTLVEAMIYMAIVGMVLVALVQFSMSISQSRNSNSVQEEVQANNRIALDRITTYIRSASGINTSTSMFDVHPGVLSLSMVDGAKNPTVLSVSADDQLLVKVGTNATSTITSNAVHVTNLVFTDVTGVSPQASIHAELTTEALGDSVDLSFAQSIETTVSPRYK